MPATFSHVICRRGGKLHHVAYNDDQIRQVGVDDYAVTVIAINVDGYRHDDIVSITGKLWDVIEDANDLIRKGEKEAAE